MPDQQEKSIFLQAIEIASADEQARYLRDACGTDDRLRAEIEALLRAHNKPRVVLDAPDLDSPTIDQPIQERPGALIGPYKLLQQIGEGGMGVVFMAEQTEPIQRTVALKIIKPGMDTRQVIARFEAERQALAIMDHPNIAKVLDAGTTDAARPYFVMELVKGVPITKYCDEKHLPLRARMELFLQVCQAVQHAHQKGIIHRDIKPNNVLVAEYDNHAEPKVIDFGVAKATAQKLTERTMFTEFGQVLGTMEYMSPEQAKLNQLDIDTRSDIYSLGVLLYELLAGSTPFEGKRLHEAAFDEMLRIIREEEPPKPSTRLSSISHWERAGVRESSSLASIAANRHTEPARLSKEVQGELDWIVMKALEKDRNRRYETANGFAADIDRYLHDEPVQAGPPSAAYRFRKFARRNKAALIMSSVVTFMLAAAAVVSAWQAVRATRASREAESARQNEAKLRQQAEVSETKAKTEAVKSQQVARFLKDMLKAVEPSVARGRDTAVLRDIMDGAAGRIATDLKRQPDVEAELRNVMGFVYWSLGEYEKSESMHRAALALYAELLGSEHLLLADSRRLLALTLRDQGKLAEAETQLRDALATQKKLLGDENEEVAHSLRDLGVVLWSEKKLDEAESIAREALAIRRKLKGNEHHLVADSLNRLAGVLNEAGKYAEAEALVREAMVIGKRRFGNSPDVIFVASLETLTSVLRHQGRLAEAEAAAREGLDVSSTITGEGSSWTVPSLHYLVVILEQEGKQDELEKVFNRYPVPTRGSPRRRAELLRSRNALFVRKGDSEQQAAERAAQLDKLLDSGNAISPQQAEASWHHDVALYDRLVHDNPGIVYYRWRLASCHFELGNVLQSNGQPQVAEKSYAMAGQLAQKLVSEEPDNLAYLQHAVACKFAIARCLLATNRRDDAEKICRQTIDLVDELTTKNRMDRVALGGVYFEVGTMFGSLGQGKEAERAFRSATKLRKQLVAEFPDVPGHRLDLGHSLRMLNEHDNAIAEFSRAIEKWPNDLQFLHWRAASFSNLDQRDKAMADLQEASRRGYADIDQLKSDASFDPLRSREDFKKLLGEAEKGSVVGEDR